MKKQAIILFSFGILFFACSIFSDFFVAYFPFAFIFFVVLGIVSTGIALALYFDIGRLPDEKTMAMDFAIFMKELMTRRVNLCVFVFEDGWWQAKCVKGDDSWLEGSWTYDELNSMITSSLKILFNDDNVLKKCFLPEYVRYAIIFNEDDHLGLYFEYD